MGFAYSFTTSNGRTIVGTDALRKYADGLVLGTPEHALWYLSDLHFGVLAAQGRSTLVSLEEADAALEAAERDDAERITYDNLKRYLELGAAERKRLKSLAGEGSAPPRSVRCRSARDDAGDGADHPHAGPVRSHRAPG